MDFASRSGRIKKYTVVAAYSGKDWPKEKQKYTKQYLEFKTKFMSHLHNKCADFQIKRFRLPKNKKGNKRN